LEFGRIGETIGAENRKGGSMKYRIAMWASAGFLVAGCWGLYFAVRSKDIPIEPLVYTLARFTQPIAVLSSYPLSLYLVLFANAATYALVGLIVETLRQHLHHAESSKTAH